MESSNKEISETQHKLATWLTTFDALSDIQPITVTIKGTHHVGVSYRDSNFSNEPRLYLLGKLPKCYGDKRGSRIAFVIDGADWYVATHMQDPIPNQYALYHPCGQYFMLCKWSVPNGDAIDRYEPTPYTRVTAVVTI